MVRGNETFCFEANIIDLPLDRNGLEDEINESGVMWALMTTELTKAVSVDKLSNEILRNVNII